MNIFNMMMQFRQNPLGILQQRYHIPNGLNTPDQILKHLVDTGQVTEQQINSVRNNPLMQYINKK